MSSEDMDLVDVLCGSDFNRSSTRYAKRQLPSTQYDVVFRTPQAAHPIILIQLTRV
jgi:hypothetical protein